MINFTRYGDPENNKTTEVPTRALQALVEKKEELKASFQTNSYEEILFYAERMVNFIDHVFKNVK